VAVEGAFFSVGDPHAAQGDSELGGTAIETSLTGEFEFVLHKKDDLEGTVLEGLNHPMLETDDQWSVYGFTYPNYLATLGANGQTTVTEHSSLDHAMRDAFRKLRRFLMTVHKLSEDEAIALMSVAADFGVTQVVDANWGVHGSIKRACSPNITRCRVPDDCIDTRRSCIILGREMMRELIDELGRHKS